MDSALAWLNESVSTIESLIPAAPNFHVLEPLGIRNALNGPITEVLQYIRWLTPA
jgi:hypothetical protein